MCSAVGKKSPFLPEAQCKASKRGNPKVCGLKILFLVTKECFKSRTVENLFKRNPCLPKHLMENSSERLKPTCFLFPTPGGETFRDKCWINSTRFKYIIKG